MNVRRQAEEALLKTTMELKRLNRSLRDIYQTMGDDKEASEA